MTSNIELTLRRSNGDRLQEVTCVHRFPLKLMCKIYKTVIRPVVIYGSECCDVKGTDEKRMVEADMPMLIWMSGVKCCYKNG